MPLRWFSLLALLVVFGWIVHLALESRVLFRVRAENGKLARAKGRAPGTLLHDLEDVFRRAKASGNVTVRIRAGRAEVVMSGLNANVEQQVRNVVGRFPLARLRAGQPIKERK